MKTVFSTLVAMLVISTSIASKKMDLMDAIHHPQIDIKIDCSDDYEKNISLEIKSSFHQNVEIRIPSGTKFYPENEEEQTLINTDELFVEVGKNSSRKVKFKGFCTELSDRSPASSFSLKEDTAKKLQKLINFLSANKIDPHNTQEAIWCITDQSSISNVYIEKDTALDRQLQVLLSAMSGQEITWYKSKRVISIDAERNIIANPVLVTGKIEFANPVASKVKAFIIDEEGNEVYNLNQEFDMRKSQKVTLSFNLRVNGWDKGNYKVVYKTTDNRILTTKEFEV